MSSLAKKTKPYPKTIPIEEKKEKEGSSRQESYGEIFYEICFLLNIGIISVLWQRDIPNGHNWI